MARLSDKAFLCLLIEALEAKLDAKILGTGAPITKPVQVFRLEFPNGHGPFNSGRPDKDRIYRALCDPDVMGLECSKYARKNKTQCGLSDKAFHKAFPAMRYGCESVKALSQWFPKKARQYLKEKGCRCFVYALPVGTQLLETGANGEVIYDASKAQLAQELDIVTLK